MHQELITIRIGHVTARSSIGVETSHIDIVSVILPAFPDDDERTVCVHCDTCIILNAGRGLVGLNCRTNRVAKSIKPLEVNVARITRSIQIAGPNHDVTTIACYPNSGIRSLGPLTRKFLVADIDWRVNVNLNFPGPDNFQCSIPVSLDLARNHEIIDQADLVFELPIATLRCVSGRVRAASNIGTRQSRQLVKQLPALGVASNITAID